MVDQQTYACIGMSYQLPARVLVLLLRAKESEVSCHVMGFCSSDKTFLHFMFILYTCSNSSRQKLVEHQNNSYTYIYTYPANGPFH